MFYEIISKVKSYMNSKSGGFIKSNMAYLIWVIVYILLVWNILGRSREAFIFTVVAYAVSIGIALSPVGEWLLCVLEGARKIVTSQDRNYLEPIFNEVYEQVKERTPSVSDNIELKIINAMYINACAMGWHTIAVTRGAIATLSEDELKGVLAHEFGHIVNGDTKALLIKVVGNMIFSFMILCLRLFFSGFRLFFGIFTRNQAIDFVIGGFRLLLDIAVIAFMFVGDIILSINSRTGEYLADDYASMTGYNGELTQALYLLQKMDMGGNMRLVDKLRSSHPHLEKRIARLESWQDEYEEETEVQDLDDKANTDTYTTNSNDTLPFISTLDDTSEQNISKNEIKSVDNIADDILAILKAQHLSNELMKRKRDEKED